MSDYMFMLENHLTGEQNRVRLEVESAAAHANVNLFLTGGAVRDMIAGSPIRDLDFTIEGPAVRIAKSIAQHSGAEILSVDDNRKCVQLRFPGGVPVEIGMARQERFAKPGGKPHVTPATIHEDLRGRDFTVNSLGLSLNRASRGLLLDPTNGLGDLERRELRAVGNYSLYDEPIRLWRLIRFKVRMGFAISERTQMQYQNAREAGVEKYITSRAFYEEFRNIANEPNPGEVLDALQQEKLLEGVMPGLAGPKLNPQGFAKLHKAKQLLPFGVDVHVDNAALFFLLLTEKMNPKERAAFVKALGMEKAEADSWTRLEVKAKKLEKEVQAPTLKKHSALYQLLSKAPGEHVLWLLVHSTQRVVVDRVKSYYQTYLPMAQEVTERDVIAAGAQPGTPKFAKVRDQLIASRLDARPKKPPVPETVEAPPPPPPATPLRKHG